jgi:hypothetical protein
VPQQPATAQREDADEYTLLFDADPAPAPPQRRRWLLTLVAAPVAVACLGVVAVLQAADDAAPTAADAQPRGPQRATVPQVPAESELPDTFAPIVLQGTGSTVQPVAIPATGSGHVILTAEHAGSSNFVVWTMQTPAAPNELAINEIGAYRGSVLVAATATAVDVKSDGPWTITLRPLSDAEAFDTSVTGTGNAVLRYAGKRGMASVAHAGVGKVALWEYPDERPARLLLLESGEYTGERAVSAGPNTLIIEADGDWTLSVR